MPGALSGCFCSTWPTARSIIGAARGMAAQHQIHDKPCQAIILLDVLDDGFDMRPRQRLHIGRWVLVYLLDVVTDFVRRFQQNLAEQTLFIAEVQVNRPDCHTGALGDFPRCRFR